MFWIIKSFGGIGTDNIPGTLARSCWSSIGISDCTVNEGWLGTLFASVADNIGLSGADTPNWVVDIGWFGALSAYIIDSIVLLSAGVLNSAIDID